MKKAEHLSKEEYAAARKLVMEFLRELKSDVVSRIHVSGVKITPLEYRVLLSLGEGHHTLGELAKMLCVEPPSIVPSVESLVARGCIARGVDSEDRRRVPLSLTSSGTKLLATVPSGEHEMLSKALRALGTASSRQFLSALALIVDEMKKK